MNVWLHGNVSVMLDHVTSVEVFEDRYSGYIKFVLRVHSIGGATQVVMSHADEARVCAARDSIVAALEALPSQRHTRYLMDVGEATP